MKQIDIDKIISEIRAEIKENGYTSDLLSFKDINIAEATNLEEIISLSYFTRSKAEIEEYPDWGNGSSFASIKVFVKKAIRKCLKFYIVPIVEKQNQYNVLAADRIVDYCKLLEQKEDQIINLRKRILELEKKYDKLEKMLQRKKE